MITEYHIKVMALNTDVAKMVPNEVLEDWQHDYTPIFESISLHTVGNFGDVLNYKFKDFDQESQIGFVHIATTPELYAQLIDALALDNTTLEENLE